MKDFINKYWIHALGVSLLFIAFLLFLKLAVENGWLPIELKLALSAVFGVSLIFFGLRPNAKNLVGEICAGLGVAVLYATIGFVSFSEALHWSDGSLLISMMVVGISITAISVKKELRVLFSLGVLGGFITPFILEASAELDIALFIYVLLLSVFCIYVGILKNWKENLILAFVMTGALYTSYYFIFDPISWQRPFVYVTTLFLVFTSGFMVSFNKERYNLNAIELLLSIVNGVHFIFWCYFILKQFVMPHALPMGLVGLTFLLCGLYIYIKSNKEATAASLVYLLLSVLSLVIVGSDISLLFVENGLNYVIISGIWIAILYGVYYFSRHLKDHLLQLVSIAGFIAVVVYWFTKAWDVDWLPIFGVKYIPFLNPGALVWILLAILGFRMSLDLRNNYFESEQQQLFESRVLALISHLIVGGLLSFQIMNLWSAYDLRWMSEDLGLSLCWFLYALVLFIWNWYAEDRFFRRFGGFVLVVSTIKVLFWDIEGKSSIEKIIYLLIFGAVTLLIAKIKSSKKEAGDAEGQSKDIALDESGKK